MKQSFEQSMGKSTVGLQGLLAREPVECGVYIGYGKRNMVSLVLDSLAKKMPAEVIWIDAGNCFDVYRFSRGVRSRGRDPRPLLKNIHVARPFTAFQLHEIINKVPRRSGPPPLVVISDLMGLFYDESLRDKDMKRAFREFEIRLADLGRRAVVVGLVIDRDIPINRGHLLNPVLSIARRVFVPSCTAREELSQPLRRAAVAVCSFVLFSGAALVKRALQLCVLGLLGLAAVRG